MTNKKAFQIMAEKMDARQRAIDEVRRLHENGQEIPDQYQHMLAFIDEKPWRQDRKVIRRVKRAARAAARNTK